MMVVVVVVVAEGKKVRKCVLAEPIVPRKISPRDPWTHLNALHVLTPPRTCISSRLVQVSDQECRLINFCYRGEG
jgi:hypothetical protein